MSRRKTSSNGRVLGEIRRELGRLERRRDEIDRAILRLRQALAWLTAPARSGSRAAQGLTDACRAALRISPAGLTPREVRRVLTRGGFAWTAFTNPMSAIHTVLKRLVSQGEAVAAVDVAGERRFVWKRRGWEGYTGTQAEEAARIEHLLDGALTTDAYAGLRRHWRQTRQRDVR